MTRSMTGYGREQGIVNGRDIMVEIRSVNHRYYEFNARIPRTYGYLEDKLKALLSGKINRGKIEVSVLIYNIDKKETEVSINKSVVNGYIQALRSIKDEFNIKDNLSLSHIISLPDAFTLVKQTADEDEVWDAVSGIATVALEKFVHMRETEGNRLKDDIVVKLNEIKESVEVIERQADGFSDLYRDKLFEKMQSILSDTNIDQQRILLEAAVFAEKTAIDEEIVRMRSHIAEFLNMLMSDDVVGRKLDFLIQELNREVNTIGSKAQKLEIIKTVVNIKSDIEKIREQVQNIE